MRSAAGVRTLLLLGGQEWQPGALAADAWWLQRATKRVVTVLTSAAQDIPETQVEWARAHFAELEAEVEGCLIQTEELAEDEELAEQLRLASAVYLCGGDPAAASRVLAGSKAGSALREAYRAGTPVAGSSAGAMALGQHCLLPSRDFTLGPGVGLFEAVVFPHWCEVGEAWRAAAGRIAAQHQVVGIDGSTGLCWDGHSWSVRGPGGAWLVDVAAGLSTAEDGLAPPVE